MTRTARTRNSAVPPHYKATDWLQWSVWKGGNGLMPGKRTPGILEILI
jgi:hypothetical protein